MAISRRKRRRLGSNLASKEAMQGFWEKRQIHISVRMEMGMAMVSVLRGISLRFDPRNAYAGRPVPPSHVNRIFVAILRRGGKNLRNREARCLVQGPSRRRRRSSCGGRMCSCRHRRTPSPACKYTSTKGDRCLWIVCGL